jgi:hypothetical protein
VLAVERPAVKPQTAASIEEILDVHEELVTRFLHVPRAIKEQSDLRERQHAHHERVIPKLLRVL